MAQATYQGFIDKGLSDEQIKQEFPKFWEAEHGTPTGQGIGSALSTITQAGQSLLGQVGSSYITGSTSDGGFTYPDYTAPSTDPYEYEGGAFTSPTVNPYEGIGDFTAPTMPDWTPFEGIGDFQRDPWTGSFSYDPYKWTGGNFSPGSYSWGGGAFQPGEYSWDRSFEFPAFERDEFAYDEFDPEAIPFEKRKQEPLDIQSILRQANQMKAITGVNPSAEFIKGIAEPALMAKSKETVALTELENQRRRYEEQKAFERYRFDRTQAFQEFSFGEQMDFQEHQAQRGAALSDYMSDRSESFGQFMAGEGRRFSEHLTDRSQDFGQWQMGEQARLQGYLADRQDSWQNYATQLGIAELNYRTDYAEHLATQAVNLTNYTNRYNTALTNWQGEYQSELAQWEVDADVAWKNYANEYGEGQWAHRQTEINKVDDAWRTYSQQYNAGAEAWRLGAQHDLTTSWNQYTQGYEAAYDAYNRPLDQADALERIEASKSQSAYDSMAQSLYGVDYKDLDSNHKQEVLEDLGLWKEEEGGGSSWGIQIG